MGGSGRGFGLWRKPRRGERGERKRRGLSGHFRSALRRADAGLPGLDTCTDVGFHMAAANSTPPGSLDVNQPGFPKQILGTELEVKYLCSECRNILRRPFQAQCGHRYCSYCLKKIISSGPQKCAACIQEGIYEPDVSILESSSVSESRSPLPLCSPVTSWRAQDLLAPLRLPFRRLEFQDSNPEQLLNLRAVAGKGPMAGGGVIHSPALLWPRRGLQGTGGVRILGASCQYFRVICHRGVLGGEGILGRVSHPPLPDRCLRKKPAPLLTCDSAVCLSVSVRNSRCVCVPPPFETFPDNAARREVESLLALCVNEGCAWKGTIKEYESCHEGSCPFTLVACPACGAMTRLSEKERHAERECPERSLNCKYCKVLCYFPDIKAHDEVCPKFPLTCEGCGKKKIPREKFQDHVKTCSKCKAPCRFQLVGCTEEVENEQLLDHEAKRLGEHLYMLLSFVLSLRSEASKLQPLPLGLASSAEAGAALLGGHPLVSEAELPSSIGLLGRCEALERKTVTFENIVCVLNREVERVSLTAEAHSRQHQADQEKIEALSSKVRQLERSIALKDLALAEMERTVQEMEASSHDGVFIWKITDVARKRQEAIAGRSPAIFSPAFYTSRYGYKMCLRIYLNGDGTGRGTHLSLFFVVMKGPSDALLRWPFNQKVTLMLLDQNNREHVIDAFRPDVTSSSFQRPVSDMNIASGCPLFCPIAKMESRNSYVRDDTLFIKAIVDLTGL
ncbi:hypothetical protein lerEdw1_014331 [Lerista edwardsae]|nr:hypothetical protein lerEdw1_014331 [Lerista edwardsae]